MMKHIRISNNAHMQIVNRKTYELTSVEKVVDDIMANISKPVSVAAPSGPCEQCEEHKRSLEKSNNVGLEIQGKYNDLRVEYKALEEKLAAAKEDIEALESVSDVVVLDEDNEILG